MWIFMIDIMINVTANIAMFSDGRDMLKTILTSIKHYLCCSFICCLCALTFLTKSKKVNNNNTEQESQDTDDHDNNMNQTRPKLVNDHSPGSHTGVEITPVISQVDTKNKPEAASSDVLTDLGSNLSAIKSTDDHSAAIDGILEELRYISDEESEITDDGNDDDDNNDDDSEFDSGSQIFYENLQT